MPDSRTAKLQAVAAAVKARLGLSDQPRQLSEPVTEPISKFDLVDDSPISLREFRKRLPRSIRDPRSKKTVYVSQSLISALREMDLGQRCPKQLYETRIAKRVREETTNAQLMGSLFEYQLTGATNYYGEIPERMTTRTGKETSEQLRIDLNVEYAKNALYGPLGVPRNRKHDVAVTFKCLSGTMDLTYEAPVLWTGIEAISGNFGREGDYGVSKDGKAFVRATSGQWREVEPDQIPEGLQVAKAGKPVKRMTCIDDIKYTGLLGEETKRKPFSWYPGTIGYKYHKWLQSCHYSLLAKLKQRRKRDVRFRFLVFDNRGNHEGEYQPYLMAPDQAMLYKHLNLVLTTVEFLQKELRKEDGFKAVPKYRQCIGCELRDTCREAKTKPDLLVVKPNEPAT